MNILASSLAKDPDCLRKALERIRELDKFVANWLLVQATAYEYGKLRQPISVGIIRTDYMVDQISGQLKLVELNTFAVGGLQYS